MMQAERFSPVSSIPQEFSPPHGFQTRFLEALQPIISRLPSSVRETLAGAYLSLLASSGVEDSLPHAEVPMGERGFQLRGIPRGIASLEKRSRDVVRGVKQKLVPLATAASIAIPPLGIGSPTRSVTPDASPDVPGVVDGPRFSPEEQGEPEGTPVAFAPDPGEFVRVDLSDYEQAGFTVPYDPVFLAFEGSEQDGTLGVILHAPDTPQRVSLLDEATYTGDVLLFIVPTSQGPRRYYFPLKSPLGGENGSPPVGEASFAYRQVVAQGEVAGGNVWLTTPDGKKILLVKIVTNVSPDGLSFREGDVIAGEGDELVAVFVQEEDGSVSILWETYTPVEEPVITGETNANLNLREFPSADGALLHTFPLGTALEIIGVSAENTEWFYVRSGEFQGWVNGRYVVLPSNFDPSRAPLYDANRNRIERVSDIVVEPDTWKLLVAEEHPALFRELDIKSAIALRLPGYQHAWIIGTNIERVYIIGADFGELQSVLDLLGIYVPDDMPSVILVREVENYDNERDDTFVHIEGTLSRGRQLDRFILPTIENGYRLYRGYVGRWFLEVLHERNPEYVESTFNSHALTSLFIATHGFFGRPTSEVMEARGYRTSRAFDIRYTP